MIDLADLDIEQLEELRNAVNQRILEKRQTTGLALPDLLRLLEEVKASLHDQGKEWHSLERWQYHEGSIRFWLNPKDHELYQAGWFTIDDLIAWGRDVGPIMTEDQDDDHPWMDTDGVQITWLPKGQSADTIGEADDPVSHR